MRIVFYSGGALSWAAAMRTIERHGRADVRLLFTDTSMEDEDLYRFLDDSERQLGVPLIRLQEGRTPWQVYRDERMMGNSRVDPCSKILKREQARTWLAANAPGATLVFGIDWTEMHRLDGLVARYGETGHPVEAPMCDAPWMTKGDVLRWMRAEGVEPPRLYEMGFAHNNCGGFCCRAGHGHFETLLRQMPDRYRQHEEAEQDMRDFLGKDVAILRDRSDDETKPMTLRELRETIEAGGQIDMFAIGGCGCFTEPRQGRIMSHEVYGDNDDHEGWITEERAAEMFAEGAQACREMMARFVEQGGDDAIAESIRAHWHPGWGKDPGRPEEVATDPWSA